MATLDGTMGKVTDFIDSDHNLTILAGLYQLGSKDWRTIYGGTLPLTNKLEVTANMIFGRVLGYNPFPTAGIQYPQTFDIANAINRTSEVGAAIWLASELGLLGSKWKERGKKILIGGAIGGVFDDPPNTNFDEARNRVVKSNQLLSANPNYPHRGVSKYSNFQGSTSGTWQSDALSSFPSTVGAY